jgi:Flp pilus assembly protein CpaB
MPDLAPPDRPPTPQRARLERALRRSRRGLLRHRRVLSALLAAAAVFVGIRAVAPPPPDTVAVLTASRDLASGEVLGSADLAVVRFAEGTAPAGRRTRDEVVGRTLASPMRRGEPVTDARLVQPSLLDGYPGRVAVPVRVPDAGAVRLLRVGDRVDLLMAAPRGSGPAEVSVAGAPVIAVPRASPPGGAAAQAGAPPGGLVVVAVTRAEAATLAADAVRGYLSVTISR